MTRLTHIISAWLNAAWNLIERDARFTFLFLGVLTLLTAYTGYLFLLLSLISMTLAFFTIYVARLTREAIKDERHARAKVGRLWLDFAFVFAASFVAAAIQYDQQESIDDRQSELQEKVAVRSDYLNAISQLDSLFPVVRISGIDYLNKTCIEKEESHSDICNKDDTIKLLSNQIRFFTQSKSYQEDFEKKPSGDITKIIEILKERQELSNIVWEGAYLRGADLREANLQGADLSKANFQGADLQGANMRKTNLQEADLREANLQGADLQEADLYEANLQGADLQGGDLQGARLREANLQGANLDEANLQGANLDGAKLKRTKF